MTRLTLIAALIVSALALVAAGCGGGDDESSSDAVAADQWADEFCTAVSSWKDSLQQIRDRFTDLSSLNEDTLNEAADDAESATDEFVDDLKGLGRPDTESGQEIEDSIQTLEDTVEQEKSDVKESVGNVEDLSDIPAAITAIGVRAQLDGHCAPVDVRHPPHRGRRRGARDSVRSVRDLSGHRQLTTPGPR